MNFFHANFPYSYILTNCMLVYMKTECCNHSKHFQKSCINRYEILLMIDCIQNQKTACGYEITRESYIFLKTPVRCMLTNIFKFRIEITLEDLPVQKTKFCTMIVFLSASDSEI